MKHLTVLLCSLGISCTLNGRPLYSDDETEEEPRAPAEVPTPPAAECDERSDCDDSVACTVDRCVVGGICESEPDDGRCPSGYGCDREVGCVAIPPDMDGDGYTLGEDCNDADAETHLGAEELCDGRDNDCDGLADEECLPPDNDGDGYALGEDCNDADAETHPGAPEVCNSRDDDCDGLSDEQVCGSRDRDGDGVSTPADCDDTDAAIGPDAEEVCDGRDNDCNGSVDPGCWVQEDEPDADNDGVADAADNCPLRANPNQNDLDDDGDGDLCDCDADGDGHRADSGSCNGDDCDDADDAVHPGAADHPGDWLDSNCDGDDGLPDEDADGIADGADVCPEVPDPLQRDLDDDGDGDLCDCDADADGHEAVHCGGDDCQDLNGRVAPGAPDPPDDGWDWDCDGYDA